MNDAVGAAFVPTRIGAIATSAFGALGALLAMMGIYGLVAFSVSQRQREIGVRKAIGANTGDIVRLMAGGTTKPVAAGLAGGLLLGLLGARGLSSFIVGVSAYDPLTIAGATHARAGGHRCRQHHPSPAGGESGCVEGVEE